MDSPAELSPPRRAVSAFGVLVAVTSALAVGAALRSGHVGAAAASVGVTAAAIVADIVARRRNAPAGRVWALRIAGFLAAWVPFDLGAAPPSLALAALPLAFAIDGSVRVRRLAGPMLLVAALALPCVAADVWTLVRRARPVDAGDYPARVVVPDPVLGYAAAPGVHRALRTLDGEVVYDVTYTIDAAGRRVVPGRAGPGAPETAARPPLLLFGCSYVFGEGVGDDETIAAHLARRETGMSPVPWALCGWGPQQMLANLQSGRVRRETDGTGGVAVCFLLAPDHDLRLHGSYTSMRWIARAPKFEVVDGTVTSRGSFESVDPIRTEVIRRLQAWPALDAALCSIDALAAQSMDRRMLVSVVAEARRLHAEQFGGRFLVCVWPRAGDAAAPYAADLRAAGIEVLDLTPLQETIAADPRRYSIRWDGHPTGAYYELCADALATHLARPAR